MTWQHINIQIYPSLVLISAPFVGFFPLQIFFFSSNLLVNINNYGIYMRIIIPPICLHPHILYHHLIVPI
jgi:hypothetical protein